MKKNDEKGTFSWVQHEDKVPFPLDYTALEVEQKWRINRTHIRPYILNSPLFADFYRWMRYANATGNVEDKFEHKGIPIELEPFFHRYLDEYMKGDWNTDESALQEFEHEFCKILHKEACALEQKTCQEEKCFDSGNGASVNGRDLDAAPNELYWYRRLYENKAFQGSISLSYWEQEYAYRCELLRDLSLQMPRTIQIQQLQHAIISMDAQIATMLHIIKRDNLKDTPKAGQNDFFRTFPREFINKLRDRDESSVNKSGRVAYKVKNSNVSAEICGEQVHDSMENFFKRLRSGGQTDAIRKAVRPVYLRQVCTIPEKTVFQRECEKLQEYLNQYVDESFKPENAQSYIIWRCKMYFGPLLGFSAAYTGAIQPGIDLSHGSNQVIDEIILSIYNVFYFQYLEEITYVCRANQNVEKYRDEQMGWINNRIHTGEEKSCVYESYRFRFSKMIRTLCDGVFQTVIDAEEQKLSQEKIEEVSVQMEKQCKDLYYSFGGQAYEWMNKTNFIKSWHRYNKTATSNLDDVPISLHQEDIHLCAALLMCKIWDEFNRTKCAAFASYKELVSYLHSRKGGA